jgi:prophage tail gpP-like protein
VPNLTNNLCAKRAEWECNIRRARAFEYRCKVYGFRQNLKELISVNPLWEINQLAYVYDAEANIDAELLIKSIKYKQDLSGGTVCEMVLVNPLAYTDSVFEPKAKAGKKTKSPALYMAELK